MKVKYFDHNVDGNDFVVGDLHGCHEDFLTLLNHVNFDPIKDRVISVGDLVDRGPQSLRCLDLMYEPWFHSVRGNHEDMMINSLTTPNRDILTNWLYNGGQWFQTEEPEELGIMVADAKKYMPLVIVIGKDTDKRINICHAELYKNKEGEFATDTDIDNWNFHDYQEENIIWGRTISEHKNMFKGNSKFSNDGLSTTYVGHTPTETVYEVMNHRFIDTAACYYYKQQHEAAKLTMVNINTERVYSLKISNQEIAEFNW